MRTYEEYHQILSLFEMGTPKKTIASILGMPRRTVIDCVQRYGSLEGLAKYVEEKPSVVLVDTLQSAALSDHPQLFQAYSYLLGVYLGDGCISFIRKTPRLRVSLDTAYPNLINEVKQAMETILPDNSVNIVKVKGNCVQVGCFSNALIDIFPQHGDGKKHDREIKLEGWQQRIVDAYPLLFWRGLYHTDGSRFRNIVNGTNYTRYQFSNCSTDIIQLFCDTTDKLGIHWTIKSRPPKSVNHHLAFDVFVSKRKDVDFLDRMVGPKS